MKKMSTKLLVSLSLLIALNIVLTRVASFRIPIGGVETIRIGFGGFPIIFAGLMFGPAAGAIVGAVGDVIGYFVNPMGAYMPCFTLTAALTGVIPPLVMKFFHDKKDSFWKLIVSVGIGQTITSVILVPLFLQLIFSVPMVVSIPGRIIGQAIHVPLYSTLYLIIVKRMAFVFKNGEMNHF